MPELPEVETTLRGIKPFLINQTIKEVILRHQGLRWPFPPAIEQILRNTKVLKASRRGKYILLATKKGTLILHLGMSGSLRIFTQPTPHKKHDHVDIIFKNGITLRFHDPRRFGALLWTEDKLLNHPLLKNLGPEPLSKTFSGKYLFDQTRNRNVSIKTFLMDSKHVVGVGNIYAAESLFLAKINPNRAAKRLTLQECNALASACKNVLKAAIKQGGTTLRNFVDSKGKKGYFVLKLNVYGRNGKPCKVCKTPLKLIRLGQRSTVYCTKCQR